MIQNTVTAVADNEPFTKSYNKYENYLTTITPSNYTTLTIELTNNDGSGNDDVGKTFHVKGSATNRIIFELDFVSRKQSDPIFDYTINKETAESVANN